ncbi:interphotoreceptor matrix proteoglycan 2-like [Saccostrea echinata]|uniref:interphotoreceptor matrix proteoglycan 2-like n=1 Tax=Saccostrea echinata TaxID=191078 RepID=UPI002A83EE05|nr:interphotoreceptor matrix proteoglycan 2-like [Saccostrea echinata]
MSSTVSTLASTEKETIASTSGPTDNATQPTSEQMTTITTTLSNGDDTEGTRETTTVITSTDTAQTQETTEISTTRTTENTTSSTDPTTYSPNSSGISTSNNDVSTELTTNDSYNTTSSTETTSLSNDTTSSTVPTLLPNDTTTTALESNTTAITSSPNTTSEQPNTTTEELLTTDITEQNTASTGSVDSTTEMTSTIKSTNQPMVTTTKKNHIEAIYPSIENAVLDFTFRLQFEDCSYNKTSIEKELTVVASTVNGCEYIRVKSIKSCASGRRRRSTTGLYVSVNSVFGIDAKIGVGNGSDVSNELYTALSNVPGIDGAYLNDSRNNLSNALTSQSICDADTCKSALIGRPGYVCVSENFNNTQRCAIMYYCYRQPIDCGENGECYVETEIRSGQTSYISKCRCKKEEYYWYEGTQCTERVITWQLAVIICVSGAGVLILILLFVIISLCCRNSSNSADVSFDESELIYSPSGITSLNQYKNGRTRESFKGKDNGAYMEVRETSAGGSWRPEDSANTYANIDSKLRESNYKIQIKRPQVSQYRKSDEITEF